MRAMQRPPLTPEHQKNMRPCPLPEIHADSFQHSLQVYPSYVRRRRPLERALQRPLLFRPHKRPHHATPAHWLFVTNGALSSRC